MKPKHWIRAILAIGLLSFVAIFFRLGLQSYLDLAYIKQQRSALDAFIGENPARASVFYFATYVLVTALSLPGAAILTLLAGAFFGLVWGTVMASFASSLGAVLAFMFSRYVFGEAIQRKFAKQLQEFNHGIEQEGGFYLFSLRLMPIVPFFLVNVLMGLTKIEIRKFYLISQIGMLPGTFVYVNAGRQLNEIESLKGILSPSVIMAFVAIGILPILSKKIIEKFARSKTQ